MDDLSLQEVVDKLLNHVEILCLEMISMEARIKELEAVAGVNK